MTWEQILESARQGVTIGSHTHTHRVLSTLSLSEQFEEFRLSKEILERKLGRPIRSIAYPVGGETDCHRETAGLAEKCGYELGFSFQTGANRLERLNPFRIGRIAPESSIPLTCAAVTLPSIFARSRYGAQHPVSFSSFYLSSTPKQNEGTL
jgi:peptidoglycan/xylan/chitin deacetylase (PgdA/CDA1 family)